MIKRTDRKVNRSKRHRRVRVHVAGTAERPRLAVFRSLNHLYAQLIDDAASKTLGSASTVQLKAKGNGVALQHLRHKSSVSELSLPIVEAARGPQDPGRLAPWSLRSEIRTRHRDFRAGKEGVN